MTINITSEIQAAYNAYLDEPVDWFFDGQPIKRRNTHPYSTSMLSGIVDFTAGWQRGLAGGTAKQFAEFLLAQPLDRPKATLDEVLAEFQAGLPK